MGGVIRGWKFTGFYFKGSSLPPGESVTRQPF